MTNGHICLVGLIIWFVLQIELILESEANDGVNESHHCGLNPECEIHPTLGNMLSTVGSL